MLRDLFPPALPSVVKSVRQRDLLNCWLRLPRNAAGLPRREAYAPTRLDDELLDMMGFDVHLASGTPRFWITQAGTRLSLAYGNSPGRFDNGNGKYLDDAIGAQRYDNVMRSYLACVELRQPVYTVAVTFDEAGKEVAYERLLLPFGAACAVEQIIGSYKTISIEGGFKITNLMSLDAGTPVTVMRAAIDPGLRLTKVPLPGAPAAAATEVVEV
jgi:hypothetical protein